MKIFLLLFEIFFPSREFRKDTDFYIKPCLIELFRRWTSVEGCGKRGKSLRRLVRGRNRTRTEGEEMEEGEEGEEGEERIIKDGRDPARVVGGQITGELEVPWQAALLRADGRWDGCGALLLNCQPAIILTAAHCVARSSH